MSLGRQVGRWEALGALPAPPGALGASGRLLGRPSGCPGPPPGGALRASGRLFWELLLQCTLGDLENQQISKNLYVLPSVALRCFFM